MLCLQCKNRNPVGNKFCRECGAPLAVPLDVLAAEEAARAELERNQERVARLLTDSHTLAEQHKFEQAILLAEEAAEQMPNSTTAQSLLAKLYEQVGATAKAAAAMERVVALNPKSEADLATLERLKHATDKPGKSGYRLSAPPVTPVMSRPTAAQSLWLPVAAAGMVGAFVLGVGLSVVNNRNAGTASAGARTETLTAAPTASSESFSNAPTAAATPAPGMVMAPGAKISLPPPSDATGDPFASQNPATPQNPRVAAAPAATNRPVTTLSAASSSLPLPSGLARNTVPRTIGPAPVKLIGVPTNTGRPAGFGTDSSFGQGGRITVGAPSVGNSENVAPSQPAPQTQPQGDGYIRISVRSPQAGNTSSNSGARAATGLDASVGPLIRAQSQQGAGQYREAIASYQMAVSADPGSAGEAYQGIALCYQRLGDTGSARAAYRNAISGYESQIASGRGTGAAQRGIASCNAALEVLGG